MCTEWPWFFDATAATWRCVMPKRDMKPRARLAYTSMKGLYGLSDCEPGGGTKSLPISARQDLFSSSVETSQADSKAENILALSG
ncbi:hypothetical protein D3C72_2385070 [compost metagenome]